MRARYSRRRFWMVIWAWCWEDLGVLGVGVSSDRGMFIALEPRLDIFRILFGG